MRADRGRISRPLVCGCKSFSHKKAQKTQKQSRERFQRHTRTLPFNHFVLYVPFAAR
jgi:hypothetical protein